MNHLDAEAVIAALHAGEWSTADLVRISHAVARRGKNTTSILGQYGEELVAAAFGGTVAAFHQKSFDVRTPDHGDLQVKTYSVGKRAGVIRSFTHDVVVVEIEPATASVRSARRYSADVLFAEFRYRHKHKYAALGLAWGGRREDRFERGWTIPASVQSEDVTERLKAVES